MLNGNSVKSKRIQRRKRLFHYALTVFQAVGIVVSMSALYRKLLPSSAPWGWTKYVECLVLIVSSACWFIARLQLGEAFAIRPQAQVLVTHGLYAYFSHPVYVFSALAFVSYVMLVDQYKWLLLLIIIVPAQLFRCNLEYQVLRKTFGGEYDEYRENVIFF
jgi:protein-S-isoprenylcysteine O-methyltransferase Ste14